MIYYIRDEEGSLIGFKYNDELYYYIKNMQEDIIGITDANYNLLCTYEYDSWGKVLSIKNPEGNLISDPSHIGYLNLYRYRSYYYDAEIGMYYLNSRYYNPEWGRFINIDGYLGVSNDILRYNLYIYASNNPINNSDDEGTFLKKACKWLKKKVSQAGKAISNGVKKIFKKAKKIVNTLKNAKFTFEAKAGLGFEVQMGKSLIIGADKSIGYDNDRGSFTSTSSNASIINYGLNIEIKNYDNGEGNPMAMPWEVINDPNTVINISGSHSEELYDNINYAIEPSASGTFIGIDLGFYLFAGFKIKIGFNIGG